MKTKIHQKVFIVGVCVTLLVLTGCSHFVNWSNMVTLDRETRLPHPENSLLKTKAKALHLDAKQRLVYSKVDSYGISTLCAEPSPDALSAVAASFLASGKSTLDNNVTNANMLGATFAEAVANIGLRTQSIQLMRDALYRTCEAYYNDALPNEDFKELHEQFQNVLVGVLAIEQLTGAVAAPAVVLKPGAAGIKQTDSGNEVITTGQGMVTIGQREGMPTTEPKEGNSGNEAEGDSEKEGSRIIKVDVPEKDMEPVSDAVVKIVNSVVNQQTVRKCIERKDRDLGEIIETVSGKRPSDDDIMKLNTQLNASSSGSISRREFIELFADNFDSVEDKDKSSTYKRAQKMIEREYRKDKICEHFLGHYLKTQSSEEECGNEEEDTQGECGDENGDENGNGNEGENGDENGSGE